MLYRDGNSVGGHMNCSDCQTRGPFARTDTEIEAGWNRRDPGWIAVEDGMPERGVKVLVWDGFRGDNGSLIGSCLIGVWANRDGEPDWFSDDNQSLNVTHWMPLPLPPSNILRASPHRSRFLSLTDHRNPEENR